MKRIVICFDGTWNSVSDPASVTNVVRVTQAVQSVASDKVPQIVYYQTGVGSEGRIDRLLGGVFGVGLRNNVKRALAFLTLNWNDENDEIYVFGFSRGAYSARALAGVINAVGGIPRQEHFDRLEEFWDFYRIDPKVRNDPKNAQSVAKKAEMRKMCYPDEKDTQPIIKLLGVWDTVGSYGIPAGLGLGGLARKLTSWTKGFHDNEFGRHVKYGLHAMAIDERRRAFPPTAWTIEKGKQLPATQSVEQVWFTGAHSNIGGGYKESGLSDLALIWMMSRAQELGGLDFDTQYIGDNFWPCSACALYRSNRKWLVSTVFPYRRRVLSQKPAAKLKDGRIMENINEKLHWSVMERRGKLAIVDETMHREYRPRNLPKTITDDMVTGGYPQGETAGKGPIGKEAEFIQACRDSTSNKRHERCVLFRTLDFNAKDKRGRGLTKMQEVWMRGVPPPI